MSIFLKQSTSVDVRLGPFVDVGDGFTPEIGVTIAASDEAEILKANGAATVAMTGTLAAVTGCDGWYDYTLATGDVDTVGELVIVMHDDDVYLPVYQRFYVLEEAIYDALFAASSNAFTGAAGASQLTALADNIITAAKIATDAIAAAKIAANAITSAKIATDAIGSAQLAANAIGASEFAQAAADLIWSSATRVLTAATNITSTGGTTVPQTGDSYARLGAPAGASVSADILALMGGFIRNGVAKSDIVFRLVDATDGYTPETGLSPTVTVSKNAGSFGATTGTVTEIADGFYQFDASAADCTAANTLTFKMSASGARDSTIHFFVVNG